MCKPAGNKISRKDPKTLCIREGKVLELQGKLNPKSEEEYPKAAFGSSFDFTSHPISDKPNKLGVRYTERKWEIPPDSGCKHSLLDWNYGG